jgi:hypothetical protein
MMVSNLAKSISLRIVEMDEWEIKEFPPNLKFIADSLEIQYFKNNDIQTKVLNLFQNIKTPKFVLPQYISN